MKTIKWATRALMETEDVAIMEEKAILVDIYDPDSIACRQLEKETYSNKKVIDFIADNFAPFRVDPRKQSVVGHYYFDWAPSQIFLDRSAREMHRSVGFLGPDDFFLTANLALGKADSANGNFDGARYHLEKVLRDYPRSEQAAEALYYLGVNRFRATGNPEELGKTALRLREKYPAGIWARKAAPYLMQMKVAAV